MIEKIIHVKYENMMEKLNKNNKKKKCIRNKFKIVKSEAVEENDFK